MTHKNYKRFFLCLFKQFGIVKHLNNISIWFLSHCFFVVVVCAFEMEQKTKQNKTCQVN